MPQKPRRLSREEILSRRRPVEQESKPTQAETQAQTAAEAAAQHPIWQECLALGKDLENLGVPWGFGVAENVMEMKPSVYAEAAAQLFMQRFGVTPGEWDTMVFLVLRDKMQRILEAIRAQRKTNLYVPGAPQVPPELMPGNGGRRHD